MLGSLRLRHLARHLQPKVHVEVPLVHDHRCETAVGVCEGSHLQSIPVAGGEDSSRTRLDEAGEVPHVIEIRVEKNLVASEIHNDRRADEVIDVVWAPRGVQDEIPIDPRLQPIVQVPDDGLPIALADLPISQSWAEFLTCLGHHDMLVWAQLVHPPHIVVEDLALPSRPHLIAGITIPMVGHAPHELLSFGVRVHGLRPHEHVVPVVVPDQQLDVQATLPQCGPEEISNKVPLFVVGVKAVLPRC
mmetsp:Transcript_91204/g.260986  ORF Transcript_91204/g.260986 Transcript_91204/m.260986 type:complete len:246 (+) Transcript_91204:100-837(+)